MQLQRSRQHQRTEHKNVLLPEIQRIGMYFLKQLKILDLQMMKYTFL